MIIKTMSKEREKIFIRIKDIIMRILVVKKLVKHGMHDTLFWCLMRLFVLLTDKILGAAH